MRAALAAASVGLALLVGGCGSGGGGHVPRGNPDGRYGPAAVDAYASVELLRALLIASSDSYFAGAPAQDAATQLSRARAAYDVLAGRVKAKDPVVDREVVARFDTLQRDLRNHIAPVRYRDLAGPLAAQLMDGVTQALVSEKASSDRGMQAEALRRVATQMAATYDASASGPDQATARLAFEESWGLWRRASALASLVKNNLGPEQGAVWDTLGNLRGAAFPNGPKTPARPPAAKVDAASSKVISALQKRFGLQI